MQIISGCRPKGGTTEYGVPSVGAENVLGLGQYDYSKVKYVPVGFFEKLRDKGADVRPKDVLLYKDGAQLGRKTYFDYSFPHETCAINEHVFILRAKELEWQPYLFFWLDQDRVTQKIINLNSNSAQPGINKSGVLGLKILYPSSGVIHKFECIISLLIQHLFTNCHESSTLAALRDTLLPKLISGEIRVPDAERIVGRCI
jgi:type I restriction enzyme S subunit